MGISSSCPFSANNDLESGIESIIVRSISFGDDEVKTPTRSISFKGKDSMPTIMQFDGTGKMMVEGSIDMKTTSTETIVTIESSHPLPIIESPKQLVPVLDMNNPRHEAAIKLQKVYKSFRTRRKLADCAVLIEQSWWKLLDFAELKRSSISYFDIEKRESAISRWSRARTKAAKVGKGLSKNGKAQKLALQHWLEAIDPRHRYGHNLHFYYDKWLNSQSKEPFFYWLDIGEGKEMNLVDKCSRSKLLQQCIKYLGPMERMAYEVVINDGKLMFKQTGELLDTSEPKGAKWIFVLSTSMSLYVAQKKKGKFQHSSFLAGGAASSAGRIVVENGILKSVWPHSGHYRPTPENFQDFISFLKKNNLDLEDVKLDPADEDEESLAKTNSIQIRSIPSMEVDTIDKNGLEKAISSSEKPLVNHGRRLSALSIPDKEDFLETLRKENETLTVQETKQLTYSDDDDEDETPEVNRILEGINSKEKKKNSFQLGRQMSGKWSTGAGPRIGCLRDYPPVLQTHALEQVNLSPRSIINRQEEEVVHIKKSGFSGFSTPQPSPLGNNRRKLPRLI
ncbi:IQ domain-containing protein IQM2-like [Impatiens glandulifera]|uniref:IQ domain-containing protein IQM2-like n=1 Tax=Impatiens glandulifera TaxID=253017 RepID=UPI001FB0D27A|nr:IQ domain-containing protein IQM2-like [Impatiens glandulifera]